MAASFSDLVADRTPTQEFTDLQTALSGQGFPVTAWQSGQVVYTLLKVMAATFADRAKLVAAIAKGVLLDLSTGPWLTFLAASFFALTRYPATYAAGSVRIAIAGGNPGQTIAPGALWIKTTTGLRYNSTNAAPVVIGAGSSAVIPFRAESPGSSYNAALATGLTMVTAYPGMTATFEDLGAGTWLATQGADEELDAALRTRCRSRWATVGLQKTADAFLYLATNTPGVTTQPNRVYVDASNPRGPGTVNVWIAGPAGPVSGADETAVRSYIVARESPCTDIQVANAATHAVTIAANVFYAAEYTSAVAQATSNVTALVQALPLGGTLRYAAVIEQLMLPDGVSNVSGVTINGASADLALAVNEVATVSAVTLTGIVS